MTMKNFILFLFVFVLFSCRTTKLPKGTTALSQKTSAGFIPNRLVNEAAQTSYGTVFFDASKRSAVTTIYDTAKVRPMYLAEEQPDAVVSFVENVTAGLTASSDANDIQATANLTRALSTTVQKMTTKSNALNYLRTSLYRLNESFYNNTVDTTYAHLYKESLKYAKEIQLKELQLQILQEQNDTIPNVEESLTTLREARTQNEVTPIESEEKEDK
ncbi:hypothetical protein GCM10009117_08930 [Gangjinia marincola]|uniref:Lipoprotein n=1 Tax=Gangjinia marincola TaxID=578463 RepID=A0ABP3XTZ2_9FLAO